MSRCKFALEKPFEGGASCLKRTTAGKKSRLLSRSLAFISIFCVLALLFTSLTPVVLADEPVEKSGGQIDHDLQAPNTDNPVDLKNPVTPVIEPVVPQKPEPAKQPMVKEESVVSKDSGQSADPKNQGSSDPQVGQDSVQKNNDSAPKPTLVINEVPAGATEISGEIKTEGPLPTYNLFLEIVDKNNDEKYKAELEGDPTASVNTKWTIALPDKLPPLVAGDKITITIKIPGMDWALSESAEVQSTKSGDSELEISGDNILDSVRGTPIEAPTIDKVFYGATTISGGNLLRDRVGGKVVRATVYVTLKDKDGNKKATVSVTPTSGNTWTVNLPDKVKVEAGDTVTAYQELNGSTSPDATANAEPSMAGGYKDTIKMPVGEIWIEQTNANIVSDDEQAEADEMLKSANPDIAKDFKSVKFSIDGTDHAYYEVTYTDGSTSGKVEAPNLKIKQVTEHSRGAILNDITIVDSVIKGKLAGEGPFDGIKVQLILKLSEAVKDSYCDGGNCSVDKDTSNPVDATVDGTTGEFSYTIPNPDLKLDQAIGVTVKEPHKFKSCSKTTVKPVIVGKTEVRDPRKLTAEDKGKIIEAIKTAYTVNGESKLPNGTGDWDGVPAVIQIDDSGNVKIFSGNDVAGTWDPNNNYKFVPETDEDGSYKLKDGAEPKITIQAKDLLKNIAPKSPVIAVDTDNGEVTITPPAYKEPGDDTDLASYTITYKDASGAEKTVTATRDSDTNKWSGTGVDADTGVITLSVEDVELAGTVTATAKDNGGLEGDTDKLDSAVASKDLETATVSYNGNGGTGEMEGKKLNKGSKYKILDNTFTAPDDTKEFKAWEVDGKEVAPGTEITVTKDTMVKAIWKEKEKVNEPSPVVPPVIGGKNPRDIPPRYVVTPQASVQPAPGPSPSPSPSAPRVYKTLPRTGESNGLPLLASALLALLGGVLILSRKRS